MCCPVFQGRDELGDHAGGPSEKDHEQHTDYESPDAAPPRHGRPGVTDRDGGAASDGATNKKTELYLEQCLGRNRDNRLRIRTSVMSDSSGCVWSEIIPLFLSEGLRSASSKGTEERRRAKNGNKKKKLPG